MKKMISLFRKSAQSAGELAAFGSILLFVIAGIVRVGMNSSFNMNQQLRVFRMAMSESYRTAEGQYNPNGWRASAARNTASILLVEDRLSVDPTNKFGNLDRIPMVTQATASFSKNLFYPTDYGDNFDLPVYDVIVNGQRFVFTTAAFKQVNLGAQGSTPLCTSDPATGKCWEPNCINTGRVNAANLPIIAGCHMLFRVNTNYEVNADDWCEGVDSPAVGCHERNLDLDHRFDLDFNGANDGSEPSTLAEREEFWWQWFMVAGIRHGKQDFLDYPLNNGKAPLPGRYVGGIDAENQINTSLDVDGDLKPEFILDDNANPDGVMQWVRVIDYQDGDLNFTTDDRDGGSWNIIASDPGPCPNPRPTGVCTAIGSEQVAQNFVGSCSNWRCQKLNVGISEDIVMYSITRDGTVFKIEEGELLSPSNGRFVRSTNRNDRIDIIQRGFQLSNDTGRFCSGDTPRSWGVGFNYSRGIRNPVEACGDCFSPANIEKTCFHTEPDRPPKIFIRSRLEDRRGRKWITPTGG